METEGQQEPPDDFVSWARAEALRFTRQKLKRWSMLFLGSVSLMILISDGMPGHMLWRILRIPIGIACACTFAPTLYYAAMLIGEWIDKRQYP